MTLRQARGSRVTLNAENHNASVVFETLGGDAALCTSPVSESDFSLHRRKGIRIRMLDQFRGNPYIALLRVERLKAGTYVCSPGFGFWQLSIFFASPGWVKARKLTALLNVERHNQSQRGQVECGDNSEVAIPSGLFWFLETPIGLTR